jgi:hypothetical protein
MAPSESDQKQIARNFPRTFNESEYTKQSTSATPFAVIDVSPASTRWRATLDLHHARKDGSFATVGDLACQRARPQSKFFEA